MTANTEPIFVLTPVIGAVLIDTANTAKDGTGTVGTVITGGTNGTRITRITIQSIGTTTAGMVRLYIDIGATIHMWKEIAVDAVTGSATLEEFIYVLNLTGETALVLPTGCILLASTEKSESFNIIAEGGDY